MRAKAETPLGGPSGVVGGIWGGRSLAQACVDVRKPGVSRPNLYTLRKGMGRVVSVTLAQNAPILSVNPRSAGSSRYERRKGDYSPCLVWCIVL